MWMSLFRTIEQPTKAKFHLFGVAMTRAIAGVLRKRGNKWPLGEI
jgi:hypothetical protein